MMGLGMLAGLGWLGMGTMWLWMLLPLALIIGAAWLAATGPGGRNRRRPDDEAEMTLRRRLAAGEIDVEQYQQARAALGLPREA